MDDELEYLREDATGETVPLSAAEQPYERVEPPMDPAGLKPSPPLATQPKNEPNPEETQFSLRGLMVLSTMTCCVLAVGAKVRLDIFAGTLGILTLVTGGVMSMLDVRRAIVHLGWWILLGTYIFACFVAVMQQTRG